MRDDTVTILLSTFNGARYLQEQLESFEFQSFRNWRLIVSDDGSEDRTLEILSGFRDRIGAHRVELRSGPGRGFVRNFLTLACTVPVRTCYYAFSDQDDVWEKEKLAQAVALLSGHSGDRPLLYCSRTKLIDEQDRATGHSSLFRRAPSFRNALVQSIAGGNTMVFNERARDLLASVGSEIVVPSHDWWLYILTTGAGGTVIYDPTPTIRYRVHGANLVGSNTGFADQTLRFEMLLRGRFMRWNEQNTSVLERHRHLLCPENQRTLSIFQAARRASLLRRVAGILASGVHRQTVPGNLGLALATLFKRI